MPGDPAWIGRRVVAHLGPAGRGGYAEAVVAPVGALHELPDPVVGLDRAWGSVAPGGRLVVLEWCLPEEPDEDRSLEGQLLWGIQIDELFQGTRMYTLDGLEQLYARAGVPAPGVVELPSGATLLVTRRAAAEPTG